MPTNSPCNGTTTAVEGINSYDAVTIFPNPCGKELNINFGKNLNDVIEIYNAIGAIVKTQVINGNSVKINTDDLSSGLYFVGKRNKNMMYKKIYVNN